MPLLWEPTTPKPLSENAVMQYYNRFKLADVEQRLQYKFQNKAYLVEAMIHSSQPQAPYVSEKKAHKPVNDTFFRTPCYERFEFVGDAVLDAIVMEYFYNVYKDADEGQLSQLKY
jgi:dsRNA-specific ribonuclease